MSMSAARGTSVLGYGAAITATRALPVVGLIVASIRLSPDEFGAVALYVNGLTTATLLADSGTDNAATWMLSRADKAQSKRTVGALIVSRVVLTVTATIILLALQPHAAEPADVVILIAASAGVSAITARNSVVRIARRVAGGGEPALMLTEKGSAAALFVAAVMLLPPSAPTLIWAFLLATLAGALLATRRIDADLADVVAHLRQIFRQAAPFTATAVCATLIWRLPVILLPAASGLGAVGHLSLATYPVQLASTVPVMGAPLLLAQRASLPPRARIIRTNLVFGTTMTIAGMVLAALFSVWVPREVIARQVFVDVAILSLGLVCLSINPILVALMRTGGHMWRPVAANALGLVVLGVALGPLLIWFADAGAATAIVLAELVVTGALIVIYRSRMRTIDIEETP